MIRPSIMRKKPYRVIGYSCLHSLIFATKHGNHFVLNLNYSTTFFLTAPNLVVIQSLSELLFKLKLVLGAVIFCLCWRSHCGHKLKHNNASVVLLLWVFMITFTNFVSWMDTPFLFVFYWNSCNRCIALNLCNIVIKISCNIVFVKFAQSNIFSSCNWKSCKIVAYQ